MNFDIRLPRTRAEQMVDALGRLIVNGAFPSGEPLPTEERLLQQYGISRTVLREALQVLAAKGMVESRQKRGTLVTPSDSWNHLDPILLAWHGTLPADDSALTDLMEIRRVIEPAAAALAAERANAEDIMRIQSAYDGMAEAVEKMDTESFIRADLDFHFGLLKASSNRFLLPVAHAIRATMLASLRLTNSHAGKNRSVSLPLHKAVLDAIIAKDARGAEEAMRLHLADTERRRLHACTLARKA